MNYFNEVVMRGLWMGRLIVLMVVLIGCTADGIVEPLTDEPTITEEPTFLIPSTPTESVTLTPTATLTLPLASDGARLLIRDGRSRLWVVNIDGTGLTKVREEFVGTVVVNPTNPNLVAYSYSLDDAQTQNHLAIMMLPELTSILDLPLIPEWYLEQEYENWVSGTWASLWYSLNWSPDGNKLVFIGILDEHVSADVYTYSVDTAEISPLSSEPTDASYPTWSPDSRYIIFTTLDDIQTEDLDAVWAASANGSGEAQLYSLNTDDPADLNSRHEEVVGWLDNETMIVGTLAEPCLWWSRLRKVNVITHETNILWSDCYWDHAFDPTTGTIALAVTEDSHSQESVGVYLLNSSQQEWVLSYDQSVGYLDWLEMEDRFFAPIEFGLKQILITSTGEATEYHDPVFELLPDLISDPLSIQTFWSPNGQHVILLTEDGKYIASAPDFIPIPFDPPLWLRGQGEEVFWILP